MSVLSQRAPPAQKKADDRLILFAIAVIMGLLILLSAIASRASYRPGAAWTNPDEELFSKIKYPAFSGISKIQNTKMPAFVTVLNDQDILAVLACIKARWPLGLRVLQAQQNPGLTGMPASAAHGDWTTPPNCFP